MRFFTFGQKLCIYFIHWALQCFKKFNLKKEVNKKYKFKLSFLKVYEVLRIKTTIYSLSNFFKHCSSLSVLSMRLQDSGLHTPQIQSLLSAARVTHRVNDKPEKILILIFLQFFIWIWAETFNKLPLLIFGLNQCLYLTHSSS